MTAAFQQGYQASLDGKKITDNPYPVLNVRNCDWMEGYMRQGFEEAFDEEEWDAHTEDFE